MERFSLRAAYAARQSARVAWFMSHGFVMRQLRLRAPKPPIAPRTDLPVPSDEKILADMAALFVRDLANVEAGIYPPPRDGDGPPAMRLARSSAFFADLRKVHERRMAGRTGEVRGEARDRKRPAYYLQNFHYQSGGWLTEGSARIYDTQVEVLFKGAANAMRRQLLVPIHDFIAGRDQRTLRLLDIGCGTGRFLRFLAQAFPRLPSIGIDLSDTYLQEAERHLQTRPQARLALAKGEELPFADHSFDAVTSLFLFHELPAKIRKKSVSEMARILKPGGRVFLLDSLQFGDVPEYDGLLDLFPQSFHEPYFAAYMREDLARLFAGAGFRPVAEEPAFMAKVSVFEKR